MWNQLQTDAYEGMIAETTSITGANGDFVKAYFARPLGAGPFPGVVLVHHMPGWDELYREFARRFAYHGYNVICPDLYSRFGSGTPDDVTAKMRADGGVSDDSIVGDLLGGREFLAALATSNGKIGIIGTCSGGRNAFLTAGRNPGKFNAVGDLWGGRVVVAPEELNDKTPVAPLDYAKDLTAPVLGLFGNDDQNPSPEHVNVLDAKLTELGKEHEFHRYDGAGHGFFYYDRGAYRQQQAMDGWEKVFTFFAKNLG